MPIEFSEEKSELVSEEVTADIENIDEETTDSVVSEDSEESIEKELETLKQKAKAKRKIRDQLEVRRALEDYFAEKQLRQEIDYLLDEHFLETNRQLKYRGYKSKRKNRREPESEDAKT